jgi:cytochrome c peroxidase
MIPNALRRAAGLFSLFWLLALAAGCDRAASGDISAQRAPSPEWRHGGKVILASPHLTSGIPGAGPLAIEEIRDWLSRPEVHEPIDFTLPFWFADAADLVWVPPDNPLTRAKIELGRQLFFDTRLSKVSDTGCTTCHRPEQDYSIHGIMPQTNVIFNPPVTFNRLFSTRQSWDGRDESLEQQIKGPATNRFEMGMTLEDCTSRLAAIEGYRIQFEAIFGKVDFDAFAAALASFQRALVSGPSPWDYRRLLAQYKNRPPETFSAEDRQIKETLEEGARKQFMSEAAIRGEALFFSERTRCASCHSGPNLTDEGFHNVGIGMQDADPEPGHFKVTRRDEDWGAFKTPTLRNVARTSPYMHNAALRTLEEVVDWFDRGGYTHADLDRAIRPLNLSRDEKRDLVAFMEALSGPLPPVETGRLPE